MKVEILDTDVFNAIDPADIERFLVTRGWSQTLLIDEDTIAIWDSPRVEGKRHRVWVPHSRQFADYAEAMGRAIKTIAQAEDRSQLQALEEFNTLAIGDILRIHGFDPFNPQSSSVLYNYGIRLAKTGYSSIAASAAATLEKLPVHPRKKRKEVQDYLQQIRLGQTEHQSFLVKLISPITEPFPLAQLRLPLPEFEPEPPFERRAMVNLMTGLDALEHIGNRIVQGKEKFSLELFSEAVPEGVSANLCEAIIIGEDDPDNPDTSTPIEISVDWSYAIKLSVPRQRTLTFTTDMFQYIREAALLFRLHHPEEVNVSGFVVSLSRKTPSDPGTVEVFGQVYDEYRKLRLQLTEPQYADAIIAHKAGYPVQCIGTLVKKGNRYFLEPVNHFIVKDWEAPG